MFKICLFLIITVYSTTTLSKSILVLGDSISAAYRIDKKEGWVALLQEKLNQSNKSHTLFNESISGDTTAGGLARIDDALSRHKPDLVLLELGANDGLRGLSLQRTKVNLIKIIRRAKESGAQIMLLGMRIPPNYGKRYVDKFYNIYPETAKEMQIPLIPFILEDVALKKELMQNDGLHPNAKAQPIIADKIWRYILPILTL